jgi:hypothetical protein
MKIKIVAFITAIMFMFSAGAYALDIKIDDTQIEFCGHTGIPFIDSNNRTQVPLRSIMESLGAQVTWNQGTQTVSIKKDNTTVQIPMENTTSKKMDRKSKMIPLQQ